MSNTSDDAKARAEARFNRELQRSRQDDALKTEIAAQARTVDKKTARLKELLLIQLSNIQTLHGLAQILRNSDQALRVLKMCDRLNNGTRQLWLRQP